MRPSHLAIAMTAVLAAAPAFAITSDEVNAGIQFNFANPGARALGMGGAFLGLADDATETVAWLVRHHLDMSRFAFKRDSEDPQTIADFVSIVQSPERLKLLLVLTVTDIRAVGPKTLVPGDLKAMGVRVCHDMAEGLKDVDVVIMLRLQNERMSGAMLPSAGEFFKSYGLTPEKLALAKPDAIVMHPGPINRGVEVTSQVADHANSIILDQVENGVGCPTGMAYAAAAGFANRPEFALWRSKSR